MTLSECPDCGGVLVCAPGCNGLHADTRGDFYSPPPPTKQPAPHRRVPRTHRTARALATKRDKAAEVAQAHPDWNAAQVAQVVGVAPRTVRRWLEGSVPQRPPGRPRKPRKKSLTGRPPGATPLVKRAVNMVLAAECNAQQAAQKVGVSPGAVRTWLRRMQANPEVRP